MARRFTFRKLVLVMSSAGLMCLSQFASAGAFQLWEQDGASVGNYHAGRAAIAEDASTGYYNPAGLVRIKNQELVIGADPIITNFKFNGTVNVNIANADVSGPLFASSQGGGFNFVPSIQYAAPLHDKLVLGLGVFSPFGLKTSYSQESYTRYAATLTSLKVIDFSPSLGFAATDKFSLGIGLDIERANAEFNLVAGDPWMGAQLTPPVPSLFDTYGQNTGSDHAYGYHAGALYQFSPETRVGLSYFSKVIHILRGSSKFFGPLANDGRQDMGVQTSESLRTRIILPPTTTFSVFHTFNPTWDAMGTISYTQWSVIQDLTLTNVAAITGSNTPQGSHSSNNVTVVIPQNFKNTWNYSIGANYHANEKLMFRTGLGYDQTPSNNEDRNLQLPDSSRIAIAIGAHFQASQAFGFDAGWTHVMAISTRINNTLVVGDQSSTVVGSIKGGADVYGFQVKWDIV